MSDLIPWAVFAYTAAGVLVASAAAGIVHVAQRLRARRFIARLRAEGIATSEEGYFQTDQERRLLVDAYDSSEVPPWEQS
ncbi:hypothetical protein [Streptosporangium roseum]|uniref:hypothetical protein n=1 Tax=Streptosporangium roseum TaxID=2001 RepID=UPI00332B529C